MEKEYAECVGCGYCCLKALCCHGEIDKGEDYCNHLYWNGTKYRCSIAADQYVSLSIGEGCCSSLNSWRQDVKKRM